LNLCFDDVNRRGNAVRNSGACSPRDKVAIVQRFEGTQSRGASRCVDDSPKGKKDRRCQVGMNLHGDYCYGLIKIERVVLCDRQVFKKIFGSRRKDFYIRKTRVGVVCTVTRTVLENIWRVDTVESVRRTSVIRSLVESYIWRVDEVE
jgi:hypothetical protein